MVLVHGNVEITRASGGVAKSNIPTVGPARRPTPAAAPSFRLAHTLGA